MASTTHLPAMTDEEALAERLVTRQLICRHYGVGRSTFQRWILRRDWPEPVATLDRNGATGRPQLLYRWDYVKALIGRVAGSDPF